MKKKLGIAVILSVLVAVAVAVPALTAETKLPKCSGQFCKQAGCSADVLCVRGAVVTCAEVCGGH